MSLLYPRFEISSDESSIGGIVIPLDSECRSVTVLISIIVDTATREQSQTSQLQPQHQPVSHAEPAFYASFSPGPNTYYQQSPVATYPHLITPMTVAYAHGHSQHDHYPQQPQRRYVCQTCGKAFERPSSLEIHSHSHTGEKPFKCHCGRSFSVRSNWKRHEKTVCKKRHVISKIAN